MSMIHYFCPLTYDTSSKSWFLPHISQESFNLIIQFNSHLLCPEHFHDQLGWFKCIFPKCSHGPAFSYPHRLSHVPDPPTQSLCFYVFLSICMTRLPWSGGCSEEGCDQYFFQVTNTYQALWWLYFIGV